MDARSPARPARRAAAGRIPAGIPRQFLALLGKRPREALRLGDSAERNMTVLFSDIRDFTSMSERMTPGEAFGFVNACLGRMEPVVFRHHGFVDKYIGDAVMALFPRSVDDGLRAAVGTLQELRRSNARNRTSGTPPVHVGIGINTGLMMVGAVGGPRTMEATVVGDAVNLASRLESMTKVYGVPLVIGEHAYYGLRRRGDHEIRFLDRVRVRGREQPQSIYEVFDADPPAMRAAKRRTRRAFEEAVACYHFRETARATALLAECLAACPEDAPARLFLERCQRFAATGVHEGTGETQLRIAWSPEFEIGHPVIDAQHRELFERVNAFVDAMCTSPGGEQAEGMIAFLHRYVRRHFATEERSMREHGYPMLALQREQHARFSRDFRRLAADIRANLARERVFLQFRIQVLVVDWIVNHTLKLDRHFGKYLAHAGAEAPKGGSP